MAKVITADADLVADFVCPRADIPRDMIHDFSAIGVMQDGKVIGGALYENYTGVGGCVEMHVAGQDANWMTPRFLKLAFFYPFVQLECKVIRGRVPCHNVKALAFDLKLGFKLEHLLKDATPKGDQWLLAMWRADCRFLGV